MSMSMRVDNSRAYIRFNTSSYLGVSGSGSVLRGRSKNRGIIVVVLDVNDDGGRPDLPIPTVPLVPEGLEYT